HVPPKQSWPQPPQWAGLLVTSTHAPPHPTAGAEQAKSGAGSKLSASCVLDWSAPASRLAVASTAASALPPPPIPPTSAPASFDAWNLVQLTAITDQITPLSN